ncbi:MAG: hypothetical protein Q9214_000822 [Letrouitia sp. 1 TL-2023]
MRVSYLTVTSLAAIAAASPFANKLVPKQVDLAAGTEVLPTPSVIVPSPSTTTFTEDMPTIAPIQPGPDTPTAPDAPYIVTGLIPTDDTPTDPIPSPSATSTETVLTDDTSIFVSTTMSIEAPTTEVPTTEPVPTEAPTPEPVITEPTPTEYIFSKSL